MPVENQYPIKLETPASQAEGERQAQLPPSAEVIAEEERRRGALTAAGTALATEITERVLGRQTFPHSEGRTSVSFPTGPRINRQQEADVHVATPTEVRTQLSKVQLDVVPQPDRRLDEELLEHPERQVVAEVAAQQEVIDGQGERTAADEKPTEVGVLLPIKSAEPAGEVAQLPNTGASREFLIYGSEGAAGLVLAGATLLAAAKRDGKLPQLMRRARSSILENLRSRREQSLA